MPKMQRKIPSRHDYITDTPQSLIETILTKMPLKDAVRTSILSSKWRYKWATLTHLEFDDQCVSQPQDRSLANFINRFLLLHEGSISKFALNTSYLQISSDVDKWILLLSKKDVKELVLKLGGNKWFKAPSCLFSCQKLVSMELFYLALNPPLTFKGFPYLKHLELQEVDIAWNVLENLISNCPLLESLNLLHCDSLELTIRAPNLKYLILEDMIKEICLENTPKLVAITVVMVEHCSRGLSCNFDNFFGGVPSLQKLIGSNWFTHYMSIGNNTFGETEMKYEQLKVIELYGVNFDTLEEVKVVLRLMFNAPNLQELQIKSSSEEPEDSDLDFWENKCLFDCTFDRLKIVKMVKMYGVPHEVKFVGFLLANSPALETISITPYVGTTEKELSLLVKLTKFRRASSIAEMIFVQDQE